MFKKLAGSAGGLQDLFSGQIGDENENSQEELDDEQLMENCRNYYDIFIQNILGSTSHTVQWLPYHHDDPDYQQFSREYFLLGTHSSDENESVAETLYVANVRVPKYDKGQKSVIDYMKLDKDFSALQIVKVFPHECEVNKARAMKQDWKYIASITNTGDILLFNYD